MSINMNPEDRLFLQSLKDDIKEIKEENKESHKKTDKHLEKTCDEIKDVAKNQNNMAIQVNRIDERLDNHIGSTETKRVSKREWILVMITGIMAVTAIFTISL